ncbi:MAG: bifunctional metallophosphatase/5'-nucleotidase [Firmicutes bacterium]|nr:bifunctional metallophosphatase/5'-nucleotidase [Bacillota bacterium]
MTQGLNLTKGKGKRTFFEATLKIILITFAAFALLMCSPQGINTAFAEELYLTILHTNDEHGSVIPHSPTVDYHPTKENPTLGGYARLAAAVKQIRAEKSSTSEPVLLLSGGDYIGGSPYSWLIPRGYAMELTIKQLLGYDAVTIGNHEYDYGPDILAHYLIEAGYPEAHAITIVLASNAIVPTNHLLATEGLFRESVIMTLDNGLRVGLFGLIGEQAVSYTTANEPVTFADQQETAARLVEDLRNQGAQLVIALSHSGVENGEDQQLAMTVPGIDVIISGHCHTALHAPIIEGSTYIVQTGELLSNLGRLDLAYNPETGELRARNEENGIPYLIPLDYNLPLDPEIDAVIEEYTVLLNELITEKTGGRFTSVLDRVALAAFEIPNTPQLQETPFGNFVTDAMRLVTAEKTGREIDFALQANGSIRGSINPGTMPHAFGQISVYDLAELIGLGIGPDGDAGYPIVAVYLTGEEMRRALEVAALLSEMYGDTYFLQFSGLRYNYNPGNAVLFTIPFIDQPLPSTMIFPSGAVISAERYSGGGRQVDDDSLYVPLERGDEELYCLVTDTYILSFLPMVGEMMPQLDLVLKDSEGNPVADDQLDSLIVYTDGQELKVWATILEYAASQKVGNSGLPEIDEYYAATAGRINQVWSIPLVTWPLLILLAIIALIVFLVLRRRKLKKTAV